MGQAIVDLGGYAFTLHAVMVLFVGLAIEVFGWLVFVRDRESDEHVYFFIVTTTLSVWLVSFGLAGASPDHATAERWIRVAHVATPFIPAAIYHFTVSLLNRERACRLRVALQWKIGLAFAILIVPTDLVVVGAHRYAWGFYPAFGLAGFLYIGWLAIGIAFSLLEYARALEAWSDDRRRRRLKWLLGAFSFSPVALFDFAAMYGLDLYPVGYLAVVGFTAVAGYTIWRFRLVELTPSFAAGGILDALEDPLLVCDMRGRIRIVNEAVGDVLGYETSALNDRFVGRLVVDPASTGESIDDYSFLEQPVQGREMLWRAADDSEVAVAVTSRSLSDADGEHVGMVVFARDLRYRRAAEDRLEASRERFELIAKGANDGIWDWDVESDEIFYSAQWKRAIGYADTDLDDTPETWLGRVHDDDRSQVRSKLSAHLEGHASEFEAEYRIEHRDGSYRWMEARGVALRDDGGEPIRMVGTQIDVTERKELERQLRREYLHDTLTGLPNRALFLDRIGRMLDQQHEQLGESFSVCVLDIDRFTVINDSLGHEAGDDLLVRVAERLDSMTGETDTVARLGSDEFGLLLTEATEREEALWVVERISQQLNYPIWLDDEQIHLSVSIGLAVSSSEYEEDEELLRDADLAMYDAKSDRSEAIVCFDADTHHRALDRAQLESELRDAIESGELEVHYQPIVALESEQVCAYEALVRWEHPEYGDISPGRFIPIAEESGLIVALTRYVLERVCRQIATWRRRGDDTCAPVNVNISSIEITEANLKATLEEILVSHDIPEGFVRIELTERVLVDHPEGASEVFERLRDIGVPVVIDDFGTGYSSLNYLRRFDADQVKLDREFVSDLSGNPESQEIVRTVSELAKTLEMEVVAEGIEHMRELETLRSFHVAYGQGYYWSAARSADELESWDGT